MTFIDLDWRYGFDGKLTPGQPFAFPSTSGWFVNSLLSGYPRGRTAFCALLGGQNFTARC